MGDVLNGLTYEFDADSLSGNIASGSDVTTWHTTGRSEQSATLNTPMGTGKLPSFVQSATNGHSSVKFDATNSENLRTPNVSEPISYPFSVVMVFKMNKTAMNQYVLTGGGNTWAATRFESTGKIALLGHTTSAAATGAWLDGEWQIVQAVFHETNSRFLVNNGDIQFVGATAGGPLPYLRIGSSSSGLANLFNGELALGRYYNRDLQHEELRSIAKVLSRKYGISI